MSLPSSSDDRKTRSPRAHENIPRGPASRGNSASTIAGTVDSQNSDNAGSEIGDGTSSASAISFFCEHSNRNRGFHSRNDAVRDTGYSGEAQGRCATGQQSEHIRGRAGTENGPRKWTAICANVKRTGTSHHTITE